MKKAFFIVIVLFISLIYSLGLLPQKEMVPFSKDFFSVESPSVTERVWDLKKTSVGSKTELDELYQTKLDKGFRNLPVHSWFMIREAEQAKKRGDLEQAVTLATASIKFSPDLAQPYFALAQALWSQDHFQLVKIFSAFFKGQSARFGHYPTSLHLFYEIFYLLSHGILLAFTFLGILLMIKYLPLYFYDIRKHFTQEISTLLINGLKLLFLLIPFLLRLDMRWAVLFWCILFWGYAKKREKQLLLIFMIFLVYFPFFIRSFSSFLDGPSSDIILEMHRATHEDGGGETREKLQAWLSNHPDDAEVLFTLGLMEKRQGRFSQAEELYKGGISLDPKFSEAFSNLGNVYLAEKKIPLAIASYQQAIDLNPDRAAYYYNLYRALSQETLLSAKNDKLFQKARQLDPQLIDHYLAIESPHINRWVIDEILSTQKLGRRFLADFIERKGFLFWMFEGWFERIPSRSPLLVPVVFLGLLIGISSYGHTRRFLARCPMCGIPTYRFYSGTSEKESICFNCHRIFIEKEKLHPRIFEKKSLQVEEYQRQNDWVSRFVSLFFAGFGYLWKELYFRGLIFLFLFFVFILRFIYWNGIIASPIVRPSPGLWRMIFWGGLFGIFYFLSIRQIYRLKARNDGEK